MAAIAVLAAACGDRDAERSIPLPDAVPNGPIYVSLGDSYASGEGLDPYNSGTQDIADGGDRCHRSPRSYAELLPLTPAKDLNFRSCAGARIEHIYAAHQEHSAIPVGAGRQALGQLDAATDLVTITIGGNDVRFSEIIKFCATHFDCADDTDWLDDHATTTIRKWAQQKLASLPAGLESVYRTLRADAPNARILVVGYPNLFSTDWTFNGQGECLLYEAAFSDTERADINELTEQFNIAIATSALNSGVEYVQIADSFAGHETCGDQGQWLDFIDGTFDSGTFHPTEQGQRIVTRILGCYLQQNATNPNTGQPTPNATTLGDLFGSTAIGLTDDPIHQCALEFNQ